MPKIQTVTLKKTLFIMEVTVLRKLTYMSQLKFGKYFDLTVQQLLDLEKDAGVTLGSLKNFKSKSQEKNLQNYLSGKIPIYLKLKEWQFGVEETSKIG